MTNKTLEQMLNKFLPFAQKRMGFKTAPEIRFESDETNAQDPLGKTAYYEPDNSRITVYTDGRHPKDIMRSISHELVHHTQNGKGAFANSMTVGEQGYAQNDEHLREMEREAYEQGNLCFRDWEDSIKTHHNEVLDMWQKRNNKLNESVMKKFGYVNESNIPELPEEATIALQQGDTEGLAYAIEGASIDLQYALFKEYYECDTKEKHRDLSIWDCLASNLMIDVGGGDAQRGEPDPLSSGGLNEEYDEGYRDRLDQAQAANPEKTMPQIKAMLAGDSDPEQVETSPFEPKPVKGSGGERYKVGDTIKDLKLGQGQTNGPSRTGEILELTAYGAIVQFEGEDGPEKMRFKHMTKSAEDKQLARPELGDETGFSPDTMGLSEDEGLSALEEEFSEVFADDLDECGEMGEEKSIQLVVGGETGGEDVTVMKQEAHGDSDWEDDAETVAMRRSAKARDREEDRRIGVDVAEEPEDEKEAWEEEPMEEVDKDLYDKRHNKLHERLARWSTK